MSIKSYGVAFFVVGILCLAPVSVFAVDLDAFSDALENLADMTRAADRAHDALEDAMHRGGDYGRYERNWREYESRLERERIRLMARIAGVSESRIRELRRDGYGWDRIARKYDVDPRRFGYGVSRYDYDRDRWKGVPPGLAKKGGMPPGQAKKHSRGHNKKYDGRDW